MDTLIEGFAAGRLDSLQPVVPHAGQDLDHLPVAIVAALQLAPDRGHGLRQDPVAERRTIAQRPRFARQNRHIVPRIIDGLTPTKGAGMFCDHNPILPDDDPVGIGMDIDRPPDRRGQHGILVVVEPHRAGLRHGSRHAVEAVEGADIGHQLRPLGFEHLPDRLVGLFGMAVRLGIGHAFVHQPGVQLFQAFDPQARREEPLADQSDLVLDLTLPPARCWGAGDGLHEIVAAHLQKAAVVVSLLAGEDRLHRGLHVVIDASRAGALEEGKGPVMRVEHHLLALAHVGPDEHHPAVAQPDMGDLHGDGHARHQDDLMAPIELIGLARRIVERHIGLGRRSPPVLRPGLGEPAHRVITALVTQPPKLLEDPDQRQPFTGRLARIGRQELLQLALPRPDPRHRLPLPLIDEVRLTRPQDLAHGIARQMQIPGDLLHGPALNVKGPPDPRDRIHPLQLPLRPLLRNERSAKTKGGSKLNADHPA